MTPEELDEEGQKLFERAERVSGSPAPMLWAATPTLGTRPPKVRKPENKNCDFCGHELMPERITPGLNSKFDILPEGEGGSDGKVWICVDECFCSYGGCRPEDWNRLD